MLPYNMTLFEIVYVNATNPTYRYDTVLNWLFNIFIPLVSNVDIVATIVLFFSNTNLNPFDGRVGLLFVLKNHLPTRFVVQCVKDGNLKCVFSYGLKESIGIATIVCIILASDAASWFLRRNFCPPTIDDTIDDTIDETDSCKKKEPITTKSTDGESIYITLSDFKE
jgi:hypothetical protein